MTDLTKIGAAYIRVSDERQDEYSPDSQLKKIREHAERRGYFIPDEYVFYDDGISGKSVRKRGDFNRMIALAKEKEHPFDVIFVWKFSRFARNQEESLVYKNLLKRKNVAVESVSESLPDGPYGSLIERIIEWMDEFYLINLSTEVVRGMTEKASRGEPNCPPPFGYIMREGKYYPDEESGAVEVVREIFTRYANGDGMRAIVTSFHDRGLKTKNGCMIDNRRIDYILHNPCYIGYIRFSPDGTKSVSRRHYDNENIMTVKGEHEPIISMELWEAVQKRLTDVRLKYPKYSRKEQEVQYMLKGLVRCSACGGSLSTTGMNKRDKTRRIQCCNYQRGSCRTSHSVGVPKIEKEFIAALDNAIYRKQFHIVPAGPNSDVASPLIDYDKLILIEERKLERAKQAYLADVDTLEQYGKNKAEIISRIEALQKQRTETVPAEVNIEAFAKKAMQISAFIKRADVDPAAKNEELRAIINKVVYNKPHHSLALYFHDI